jgi:hypothetical protein
MWSLNPDRRVICTAPRCDWHGPAKDVDRVQDPRGDRIWSVCPLCRTAERIEDTCEYPETCWASAKFTYYAPHPALKLDVCGEHFDKLAALHGPSLSEDEWLALPDEQPSPRRPDMRCGISVRAERDRQQRAEHKRLKRQRLREANASASVRR